MREILFRGKQITDKVWVYGGIETVTDEKPYICTRARYRPKTRDWDTAEYYVKNPHYTRACVEIIPETLGQFIGVFDKNGKKIFEGDIVATKFGRLCEVVWFSSGCNNGWDFRTILDCENLQKKTPTLYDMFDSRNLEVVGNIYDNPELMEVR